MKSVTPGLVFRSFTVHTFATLPPILTEKFRDCPQFLQASDAILAANKKQPPSKYLPIGNFNYILPNVALLIRIWEVPSSNPNTEAAYPGRFLVIFLDPSRQMLGQNLKLRYEVLRPS
jgi:hypothetical protein